MTYNYSNKMSIDYQLYQMPITTQIIIPQLLPHAVNTSQPTTPDSCALSTPPKLIKTSSQLSWKKKQSAFKKFRDRSTQKNQPAAQSQSQTQNRNEQQPKRVYRLVQKVCPIKQISPNFDFRRILEESIAYYDPNLAPLYGDGNCQGISNELTTVDLPLLARNISRSTIKIQKEKHQNICLKIESLPSKRTSQVGKPEPPVQRTDDPFIIVRHNSPQKSKTKFIKKQKQKVTPHKKQDHLKASDSSPQIKESECPVNVNPFGTFRPPISLNDEVEIMEPIQIEISGSSDEQSGMELQPQKYISCD